jgi:ribonuclease BN (tRNA processing enzyme)
MKVTLLPSALGAGPLQYLTTFVVNDGVAIDAGSLGLVGTPAEQARIGHVFLTHAHIDHVGGLPIYLENVSDDSSVCPIVYAPQAVLDMVRRDVLNDGLFPDFVRISQAGPLLVRLEPLTPGKPVHVKGLTITAAEVDHVVPAVGYLVDDGTSAFVFVTDTAPTDAIWALANQCPRLKAVILEVTFPNHQIELAAAAKHLTPLQFAGEIRKVRKTVPVYAIHLKARFREQLLGEIAALGLPQVKVLEPGQPLEI